MFSWLAGLITSVVVYVKNFVLDKIVGFIVEGITN